MATNTNWRDDAPTTSQIMAINNIANGFKLRMNIPKTKGEAKDEIARLKKLVADIVSQPRAKTLVVVGRFPHDAWNEDRQFDSDFASAHDWGSQ